jgi:hypothetical protein
MPSRAMKLAVFFGSIHGALTFTAISQAAVEAPVQAKDCLAAPDHPPAQGGVWRYRTDPATKRHCWYVRGEAQEVAQPSSSAAKPPASPASTVPQGSVVDAEVATAAANAVNSDIAPGSQVFSTPSRTLVNGRAGGASNVGAGTRHRPQPASAKRVGPPAPRSVWMLLSALAGALGLVGLVTTVIARVSGRIAIRRRKNRGRARRIWSARPNRDITSSVRSSTASVRSSDEAPMDWVRIARQAQEAHRQSEQIEQLLSRVSRRSAV